MEKNGKNQLAEHYYKLNSAGNNWRRKSPDTYIKKETKNMERRDKGNGTGLGCYFSSIFTLFDSPHYLSLFLLHFIVLMKKSRSFSHGPRRRKERDKGN